MRCEQLLKDKQTKLRGGVRQKLLEMFGDGHEIQFESEDEEEDQVLWAEVEGLRFLGYRCEEGSINVVLLAPCLRCGHQMPGKPLARLADLGEGILQFEMTGLLDDHQCPLIDI